MKTMEIDFNEKLSEIYGSREAGSIIKLLSEEKIELTNDIRARLLNCEPLQYIVGRGHFYGREFRVNASTLIPRGETEELVQKIIRELSSDFCGSIVDIGTGSGAIAITLALALPKSKVTAIDISCEALKVAEQNAREFGAENIEFKELDILKCKTLEYDIVVSNPPYIRELEKEAMHQNVLDYEPHLALFVSNEDPLIFYRVIAQCATNGGKPHRLFYEINEALGNETKQMLEEVGYTNVTIERDIHNRDRIARAEYERAKQ